MNWAILTSVITREVVRELRTTIESELQSRGFAPNKHGTAFVRRNGTAIERIELTTSAVSSTDARAWVSFELKDRAIAKVAPKWKAGGRGLPAFPEDDGSKYNISKPKNAKAFIAYVKSALAWFELAADAKKLLAEASRRYVPGFVEPSVVVPYLRARLGEEGVATYATALLDARPELWPAVVGSPTLPAGVAIDHGTALVQQLKRHAPGVALRPPKDCVRSKNLSAANLRNFFGLQMRAWGEPDIAALLRGVDDKPIIAHYKKWESNELTVDDAEAALQIFDLLGMKRRKLSRTKPSPRLFQYHVLHEPFA